ncbi:MAG: phosphoribosylanthranilate isomerase [Elusimicrobia bacterium]|nr:phosphoribosylanthranilate isomerase [Elusimicrobiota bacterium]
MTTRVKFCGITRPEDAAAAAELGAWAVGLVFAPASPRRVSVERAAEVVASLPRGVLRVGVFQDQPVGEVAAAARAAGLDLIQLHGKEGEDDLRSLGPERCVRAVVLTDERSLAAALESPAAYLLADRPRDVGACRPLPSLDGGGTPAPETPGAGRTPDWALAERLAARRPMLLAGGLTPENAAEAAARARPWGLDVSSGVETAPGIKDRGRMAEFMRAITRPPPHKEDRVRGGE